MKKSFILLIENPSTYLPIALLVLLALVDSFRTFCWGEIIEELRNIYNLKELINPPASAINNV